MRKPGKLNGKSRKLQEFSGLHGGKRWRKRPGQIHKVRGTSDELPWISKVQARNARVKVSFARAWKRQWARRFGVQFRAIREITGDSCAISGDSKAGEDADTGVTSDEGGWERWGAGLRRGAR